MISLIFEHLVAFWHNKTSQVHLVLSLPQLWKQPRLEYYLETKMWDTDDAIFGHRHQTVFPTTFQAKVLCMLPKACFPTQCHPCLRYHCHHPSIPTGLVSAKTSLQASLPPASLSSNPPEHDFYNMVKGKVGFPGGPSGKEPAC